MKRIGILTFHRAHNYGAVLQCYAMQCFLQSQGYQANVIDYNKKELWDGYNWYDKEDVRFAFSSFRKIPTRCIKLLIKWFKVIPRYYKFIRFQKRQLELCSTDEITWNPFDLILIGSDQVWNTEITHGFDPFYWGTFERPASTKVASYGASLKRFWDKSDWPIVSELLTRLDAVSVREESVATRIQELGAGIVPVVVPDPVFLLSSKQWDSLAKKPAVKDPYVFFYQARDSEYVYDVAQRIADEKKMKLIVLSANVKGRNSNECRSASPAEFVGWIQNADFIVTSSFHATAFSIIFKKDFCCVDLNLGEDNRLRNTLQRFNLSERYIRSYEDFSSLQVSDFNPHGVLSMLRDSACKFIDAHLP